LTFCGIVLEERPTVECQFCNKSQRRCRLTLEGPLRRTTASYRSAGRPLKNANRCWSRGRPCERQRRGVPQRFVRVGEGVDLCPREPKSCKKDPSRNLAPHSPADYQDLSTRGHRLRGRGLVARQSARLWEVEVQDGAQVARARRRSFLFKHRQPQSRTADAEKWDRTDTRCSGKVEQVFVGFEGGQSLHLSFSVFRPYQDTSTSQFPGSGQWPSGKTPNAN